MCIKHNDDRFFSSLCFEKLRRGLWWEEMEEELCCVGCQSEDAEVEGSQPVSPCCACSNDCFLEIPQPPYDCQLVAVKEEQSLTSFRGLKCRQCCTGVGDCSGAADAGWHRWWPGPLPGLLQQLQGERVIPWGLFCCRMHLSILCDHTE